MRSWRVMVKWDKEPDKNGGHLVDYAELRREQEGVLFDTNFLLGWLQFVEETPFNP